MDIDWNNTEILLVLVTYKKCGSLYYCTLIQKKNKVQMKKKNPNYLVLNYLVHLYTMHALPYYVCYLPSTSFVLLILDQRKKNVFECDV